MLFFLRRRNSEVQKKKSDHDSGRPNERLVDALAEEFLRLGGVTDREFADFCGEKRYRTREGESGDGVRELAVHRPFERRSDRSGRGERGKERRGVEEFGKMRRSLH